jgi:hypothetical protein
MPRSVLWDCGHLPGLLGLTAPNRALVSWDRSPSSRVEVSWITQRAPTFRIQLKCIRMVSPRLPHASDWMNPELWCVPELSRPVAKLFEVKRYMRDRLLLGTEVVRLVGQVIPSHPNCGHISDATRGKGGRGGRNNDGRVGRDGRG